MWSYRNQQYGLANIWYKSWAMCGMTISSIVPHTVAIRGPGSFFCVCRVFALVYWMNTGLVLSRLWGPFWDLENVFYILWNLYFEIFGVCWQGYSSRLAAVDYTVCLHSEVFVTTQGGNFPQILMGHRRFLNKGHSKTINPDKRRLVLLLDNPEIEYTVWTLYFSFLQLL